MITIIIPTYNNEDTIDTAIDSIINQNYKDWKILIVNDRCTDNTISIIENNYLQKYQNKIKIINNEINVGVGQSRINGVNNTDTEFIMFLDSDDFILPNHLETSMKLQKTCDADVVYTGTILAMDEEHVKTLEVPDSIMDGRISTCLHFNFSKKWLTGKIFRTELLKSIPMSPNRICEDVNTLLYACYSAKKVRSSKFTGYVHLFRQGSIIDSEDNNLFHLYCISTKCDIEIGNYILDKNDIEIFEKVTHIPYLNYKKHCNDITFGKISKEDVDKEKDNWNFICNWFESHQDKFK